MNPEINDLSIDLSMFTTSLLTLRENMTYIEFDSMLRTIQEANNRAKLEVLFEKVNHIYSQGTDLDSAFEHSIFDIVQDQGENF